ncbi:MAG: dockerin type I domain-containing protein [Planctomycetota bacterium]
MFIIRTIRAFAITAAVLAVGLWALPAQAQPQHTPPWWGNDDDRTTIVTAPFNNAGDSPSPTTEPDPENPDPMVETEGDAGWINEVAGHSGVMGVQGAGKTGKVTIWVWNGIADNSEKHLWVQFDCYVQNGGVAGPSAKAGHGADSVGGFNIPNHWEDIGNGWTRHWREWTIKPQPAWEEITFTMATAESGGTAVIDNVEIGTHCEDKDPQGKVAAFNMVQPEPTEPVYVSAPVGCEATLWSAYGNNPPEWMPNVTSHEGVFGIPAMGIPADGILELWNDDLAEPEGLKHIACQFDFYMAEGGFVTWEVELPPECLIQKYDEYILETEDGWQRAVLKLDVSPPPDWEIYRWLMFTDPMSGPVAVDSVIVSSGFLFQDDWSEDFDFYMPETDLHGQYGWKGWDDDQIFTAYTSDVQALNDFNSVAIAGDSDLVHEYDYLTSGKWEFTAWQYIPSDFSSNGTGQFAGSYIVLMNTYEDGAPHEEPHWSLQMNFDSNDGMLKVYYGNGLNTVNVPYDTDRWVKLQAVIDLDEDWTRIYYDDELVTEYIWTGGVLGGGGGAVEIAALDLFANGSTPIYYDDIRLQAASRAGDMNCDGNINAYDIDGFICALSLECDYEGMFPECDRMLADCNGDGAANAYDIDRFIELVGGG